TAMLSAIEKADVERYSLLKAQQDIDLTSASVRLQDLRVTEAQGGVTLAQLQRERAQIQANHYQGLLSEGISDLEHASLVTYYAAAALKDVASAISASGGGGLLGWLFGTSQSSVAQGISYVADALSTTAQITQTLATYDRRAQDWQLALSLAQQDI